MDLIKPEMGLIFWAILSLLYIILVLLALISVMRNDFKGGNNEKWMWPLLILLLPLIGSLVYFFSGSSRKISA